MRTPYWDWTEREGAEHYRKYAGTAPVHLLFALRQAIDMLFEEKLENVFLRHRLLAEAVRRAVGVWAEGQVLGFNIAEPGERSDTVTTVVMANGHDPVALHKYCKEKCGVVLGVGIGELHGQAFRIAHMGHVNAPMVLGTPASSKSASMRFKSRTAKAEPKPRSNGSGRGGEQQRRELAPRSGDRPAAKPPIGGVLKVTSELLLAFRLPGHQLKRPLYYRSGPPARSQF